MDNEVYGATRRGKKVAEPTHQFIFCLLLNYRIMLFSGIQLVNQFLTS